MKYVAARIKVQRRETAYRTYVTDCLKILTRNTACHEASYVTVRFADILNAGRKMRELADGDATEKIKNKLR